MESSFLLKDSLKFVLLNSSESNFISLLMSMPLSSDDSKSVVSTS